MKAMVLKEPCEIMTAEGSRKKTALPLKKNPLELEDMPELDYTEHLWYEKELKSVANVARRDALEFLPLAAEIGIRPEVQEFGLEEANLALGLLKEGKMQGAGVLRIS